MTEKDRIAWARQQAAVYRMLEESASALAANADMFDGMPVDKKLAERIKAVTVTYGCEASLITVDDKGGRGPRKIQIRLSAFDSRLIRLENGSCQAVGDYFINAEGFISTHKGMFRVEAASLREDLLHKVEILRRKATVHEEFENIYPQMAGDYGEIFRRQEQFRMQYDADFRKLSGLDFPTLPIPPDPDRVREARRKQ